MTKARLKSVKLEIGKRSIELTADEAKAVFDALSELYDRKPEQIIIGQPYPVYFERRLPYYSNPVITWSSETDVSITC